MPNAFESCRAVAAHDVEAHSLRVGDEREAADPGNVPRLHMDAATQLSDPVGGAINILNTDIGEPAGLH